MLLLAGRRLLLWSIVALGQRLPWDLAPLCIDLSALALCFFFLVVGSCTVSVANVRFHLLRRFVLAVGFRFCWVSLYVCRQLSYYVESLSFQFCQMRRAIFF